MEIRHKNILIQNGLKCHLRMIESKWKTQAFSRGDSNEKTLKCVTHELNPDSGISGGN